MGILSGLSLFFSLVMAILIVNPKFLGNCPENPKIWCADIDPNRNVAEKANQFVDSLINTEAKSNDASWNDFRLFALNKLQISNDVQVAQVVPANIRKQYNVPQFIEQLYLRDFLSVILIPIAPSLPFFMLTIQTIQLLSGVLVEKQSTLMCESARWCLSYQRKMAGSDCITFSIDQDVPSEIPVVFQHNGVRSPTINFAISNNDEPLVITQQLAKTLGLWNPALPTMNIQGRQYHYVYVEQATLSGLDPLNFVQVAFPRDSNPVAPTAGKVFLEHFKVIDSGNQRKICEVGDNMPALMKLVDLLPFALVAGTWFLWAAYRTTPTFAWITVLLINARYRAPWLFTDSSFQYVQNTLNKASALALGK